MTQHRIRVHTSRGYSGYFWNFEFYRQPNPKKQDGYWASARGGYALTQWGAYRAARRAAKKYLRFEPFEKIEELR